MQRTGTSPWPVEPSPTLHAAARRPPEAHDRASNTESDPDREAPAPARMTVLVVDDNRMNQLVAAGVLRRLGHAVETASGGEAAVAACATGRFDVVLMDIMMPDMDGYEAAELIRAGSGEASRTPIIGLSARDMPGDREHAIAAGLDDYLTKPLRTEALEGALTRLVAIASGGPSDDG